MIPKPLIARFVSMNREPVECTEPCQKLIESYKERVFATPNNLVGHIKDMEYNFELNGIPESKQTIYPIPQAYDEAVERELDKLQEQKWIVPVKASFTFNSDI
jgi:hypothetical protein